MKCREVQRWIYLQREGEIPAEMSLQVRHHTESCPGCARELREAKLTEGVVAGLRSAEPQLHAQRDLTEQVMRAIQPLQTNKPRSGERDLRIPIRLLQAACTSAAIIIALVFFTQSTVDVYRMAKLESRLGQLATWASPDEPRLSAAGLNTIARFGNLASRPSAADEGGLRERLQLKEAVRSFLDVVQDGPPGVAGEVERLRGKYPDLWHMSPVNGLTAHDRLIVARQGKALMRELRTLLQPGNSDDEK